MSKTISWAIVVVVVIGIVLFFMKDKATDGGEVKVGNSNNPSVILETSLGNVELEVYETESPVTAGNFLKLVDEGFYDGTRFHRVIPGFMAQGGDPLSKQGLNEARWGTGGPGYAIEDEFIEGLSNIRGTIAMANSGPNSGGSQFFINVANNTNLDWDKPPTQSKHPVFGMVVSGMDIVDSITQVETNDRDTPTESVLLHSVKRKR